MGKVQNPIGGGKKTRVTLTKKNKIKGDAGRSKRAEKQGLRPTGGEGLTRLMGEPR